MPVSSARGSQGVSALTAQQNLARLTLGDHACLFYRDTHDELAMTAMFFAIGLRRRERCLCVFNQPRIARLRTALRAAGVAMTPPSATAAFILKTDDAYLSDGRFEPEQKVRMLGQEVPARPRRWVPPFGLPRRRKEMKWSSGASEGRHRSSSFIGL